jgi:hypothetical protein
MGRRARMKKAEDKRESRRIFLRNTAIFGGVVATGIGAYWLLRSGENASSGVYTPDNSSGDNPEYVTFQEARENEELRQKYLDGVVERFRPPVDDLRVEYDNRRKNFPESYSSDSPAVDKAPRFLTNFSMPANSIRIKDLKITAFRGAFNVSCEDDLISDLVDHEYAHVRVFSGQVHLKIDKMPDLMKELKDRVFNTKGDLYEPVQELYAYKSQIGGFNERNVSPEQRRRVLEWYSAYRKTVEQKPRTPLTQWLLEEFPEIGDF